MTSIGFKLKAGIAISALMHLGFIFSIPHSESSPAQIYIQQAPSSIQLKMVAMPKKVEVEPVQEIVEVEPVAEEEVIEVKEIEPVEETKETEEVAEGNEYVSVESKESVGAVWVEPKYLVNKPPKYPRKALIKEIEGRVVLQVHIDEEGKPTQIEVEESSGFLVLDKAALKAVGKWEFYPAFSGDKAIPSRSLVPVNFVIKK